MQTQNYVHYMHFLVSKESEQKCARVIYSGIWAGITRIPSLSICAKC